jgi:hypothetical protein
MPVPSPAETPQALIDRIDVLFASAKRRMEPNRVVEQLHDEITTVVTAALAAEPSVPPGQERPKMYWGTDPERPEMGPEWHPMEQAASGVDPSLAAPSVPGGEALRNWMPSGPELLRHMELYRKLRDSVRALDPAAADHQPAGAWDAAKWAVFNAAVWLVKETDATDGRSADGR